MGRVDRSEGFMPILVREMKNIHWIVQNNLIREKTLKAITDVLSSEGISFSEVKSIPFSDELPELEQMGDINVFYGSTTLVMNAFRTFGSGKGIFYDPERFNMQRFLAEWGDKMLNHDASLLTFTQFVALNKPNDSMWFVRPVEDDKSFSGRIMTFEEIRSLEAGLKDSNNPYLGPETLIVISSPKKIEKEWRLFVVDGRIISACRYVLNSELNVDKDDFPREMAEFALACITEFTPDSAFVMDIALCEGRYAIIECNCFNDSGFYDHDIPAILKAVQRLLEKTLTRA